MDLVLLDDECITGLSIESAMRTTIHKYPSNLKQYKKHYDWRFSLVLELLSIGLGSPLSIRLASMVEDE